VTLINRLNITLKRLILASRVASRFAEPVTQLLKMGEFLRTGNLRSIASADRYQLYARIQEELVGDAPIDYLEFGVFQGASIRWWLEANRRPESQFYGFDTFEGLPESSRQNATYSLPAGYFSTQGITPDFGDSRVRWVMFQDTLEGFTAAYKPCNRLILLTWTPTCIAARSTLLP
jgi:O-methyltransferase